MNLTTAWAQFGHSTKLENVTSRNGKLHRSFSMSVAIFHFLKSFFNVFICFYWQLGWSAHPVRLSLFALFCAELFLVWMLNKCDGRGPTNSLLVREQQKSWDPYTPATICKCKGYYTWSLLILLVIKRYIRFLPTVLCWTSNDSVMITMKRDENKKQLGSKWRNESVKKCRY